MKKIVRLHIHLGALARRLELLKSYMEKGMKEGATAETR